MKDHEMLKFSVGIGQLHSFWHCQVISPVAIYVFFTKLKLFKKQSETGKIFTNENLSAELHIERAAIFL